jgi:bifunctional DNA-binding transcriptional regulator/antitoxin component of YhaV-PrlF toxin-antitoxin module
MAMAEAIVKEWGNSLGIIIPKQLADHEGIKAGDMIKVDLIKPRMSGFGIWKDLKLKPFERDHDDHDFL